MFSAKIFEFPLWTCQPFMHAKLNKISHRARNSTILFSYFWCDFDTLRIIWLPQPKEPSLIWHIYLRFVYCYFEAKISRFNHNSICSLHIFKPTNTNTLTFLVRLCGQYVLDVSLFFLYLYIFAPLSLPFLLPRIRTHFLRSTFAFHES